MGTSYFIYSHIAKQVNINGGSIMNNAFIPPSLRGTGIYSYVSKFNIDGLTISNLNYGIDGKSGLGIRYHTISNSSFNNNVVGINFKTGQLHNLHNNEFVCSYADVPGDPDLNPGIGIYKAAVTKTLFEENNFTANSYGTQQNPSLGIVSENTSSAASLHRKNIFTTLSRGDQTQNLNAGLNLWCNEYTNTTKAWAINLTTSGTGAFRDQGECIPTRRLYPDNRFFDACTGINLIHSHSNLGFTYWRNTEAEFPQPFCSQNTVLKVISNIADCSSQGPLQSGCDAPIPLTPGNVDFFNNLVPTLPEGSERELLVNDLIRYYDDHNNPENIKTLLQNESGENYKMDYAQILLDEGNITGAIAVVNNLSASSVETDDFSTYFSVLVYAKQNNLSLAELPENRLTILENLAEGRSIGAYFAQTILTQYYGYKYPLIIETETGLEYRNRKLEISKSPDHQLIIEPNPASTEIKVSLYDPLKMMTEIELFGLDGRVHYSKKLVKQLKEYKLDVSFLNSGIYLLKVVSSNDEIIVNKFIKQ